MARHNSSTYSAAPAGGWHNYVLPRSELYNLAEDPEESYDVAPDHQEIVVEIQGRIEKLLAGFPEPVKQAYAESKARKVDPATSTGARPRPATTMEFASQTPRRNLESTPARAQRRASLVPLERLPRT